MQLPSPQVDTNIAFKFSHLKKKTNYLNYLFIFFSVSLAVPFILKRLRFLRTTFELRIAAGLCSGVAAAYYFGKDARRRCIERVENNYKY